MPSHGLVRLLHDYDVMRRSRASAHQIIADAEGEKQAAPSGTDQNPSKGMGRVMMTIAAKGVMESGGADVYCH